MRKRVLLIACATAGALLGLQLRRRYEREMQARCRDLIAGSRIVDTAVGPIEVASVGEGAPVLVVHGLGGGYDQGLIAAQLATDHGLQILAVSRFGYLRTPLPAAAGPEAQAAAFVALLDALALPRAAVIGISAGGPSSIQFALRHAERCWALVTMSAVAQPIQSRATVAGRVLAELAVRDASVWLLRALTARRTLARNGIAPDRYARLPPHERALLRDLLYPLPMSLRRQGVALDLHAIPRLPRYPVEQIRVPTLVVHGTADALVPFAQGAWLAATVPGAQFLPIAGAGHFAAITHEAAVIPPVLAFLRAHAPAAP